MVTVACGWVAAAWSAEGLLAVTLPQGDEVMAHRALASALTPWWKAVGRAGRGVAKGAEREGAVNGIRESWLDQLAVLLERYYAGQMVDFGGVTVDWRGYTPFIRDVLGVARTIPWGATRSYGEVAVLLGRPRAARAVGRALAANRTPVVIPCHRVVRGNGEIGGFGGGVEWKKKLLACEGRTSLRWQTG